MAKFITTAMLFFTGFTLPLSQVRLISAGPFNFTANKITVAGLLILAATLGAVEHRSMPNDPKRWWVVGFASSMLIGATITLLLGAPLEQMGIVATALSAVVLFYFLLVYITRSMKDLNAVLVGLICGGALTSISVLMRWGPATEGRTGGFSGDPNNFAFVSAATLPIVGYYFATAKSRFVKIALAGASVLSLVAIAASLSRTGIVVMGTMALMWMARFRRFDILRVAIPAGALLVTLIFLSSPEWRARMTTLVDRDAAAADGSMASRVQTNAMALRAFAENPVLGLGYNQFTHWARGKYSGHNAIHNSYLHVMAELGLLGIVSYLGLIAATFLEYSRCRRICLSMRARGDPAIQRIYLLATLMQISLVGTIVGNLFLNSMRYRISWMLYACSTVVLLLALQRARELTSEAPTESATAFRPAHMMDTGPQQPVRA